MILAVLFYKSLWYFLQNFEFIVPEKKFNIYFKMVVMTAVLNFHGNDFNYLFLSTNRPDTSYQVSSKLDF